MRKSIERKPSVNGKDIYAQVHYVEDVDTSSSRYDLQRDVFSPLYGVKEDK